MFASRLVWVWRSIQLSYTLAGGWTRTTDIQMISEVSRNCASDLELSIGLEPITSALQGRCST